jgi:hypothetical protein
MALPGAAPDLPHRGTVEDPLPLVSGLLTGRATSTRAFKAVCASLAPLCLALPAVLVGLALTQPTSGPQADTSRGAQLLWAGILVALGLVVLTFVGRFGTRVRDGCIVRRWGGRTVVVPWQHVSGFAVAAGRRPGVCVLRPGETALPVPTPWHSLSMAEAGEAADMLNRAFGLAPSPTAGAAARFTNGPQPRSLGADGATDPELGRILSGNVLWSRWGIVTALVSAPLGLLLPGILCALAAAPNSTDMSRPAQVGWAVLLFVTYALFVLIAGGTWSRVTDRGISTRTCWRPRRVPWNDVQAFLADGAGVVVLTRSGGRITARVRLATTGGREQSRREAAYLNGTFGLGVPLRQCQNCAEQYFETAQGLCHFHPVAPVSLGTRGEGAQRKSWWIYQCCWLVVLGAMDEHGRELDPPSTGGCRTGAHVSPDFLFPEPPPFPSTPISATLDAWLQPVRHDEVHDDGDTDDDIGTDPVHGAGALAPPPTPWPADTGTRRQARR